MKINLFASYLSAFLFFTITSSPEIDNFFRFLLLLQHNPELGNKVIFESKLNKDESRELKERDININLLKKIFISEKTLRSRI